MEFSLLDLVVFAVFVITVVSVGIFMSRKEEGSAGYFLAGRGLKWWLIGFSLIAANISTEQFVGMSGNAASHVGLAIASYEWMAAITLVVVAFAFLPYFLRAGIFTMPEFLEYRYNSWARLLMAVATLFIYMLLLGSVTYSGALTIRTLALKVGYNVPLEYGSLAIGVIAMVYVATGGLKACAWADLIQGSALIVGGALIMYFAFVKLGGVSEATTVTDVQTGAVAVKTLNPATGGVERFWELNKVRMNMFLPQGDPVLPWTALLLGLWIPNFYYWGLNQYITQRTLGSASLAEGQKGIVFAAFMKLLIPFVIVIPGIIAFNLFSHQMREEAAADKARGLAKYVKTNLKTKFVEVAESPSPEILKAWPQTGRYLIAVFPEEKQVKAVEPTNLFVLPILKREYDELQPLKNTIFISEDKAWKPLNPGLAEETEDFNKQVEKSNADRGAPAQEKLIAFKYDTAIGQLIGHILPQRTGIVGFVLAALLGAVVSSLAAMLNAASTIFSMDIYKKYVSPQAAEGTLVLLGRICVFVFTGVAIVLAPLLGNPNISNSIFTIIQECQGFISPGILAAFVVAFLVRRAPPVSGVIGLLTNIAAYGILKISVPSVQFLNRMAVCFGLCIAVMLLVTLLKPLPQPKQFQQEIAIELKSSKGALLAGIVVILLTLTLYVLFSPWGLAR
ncbi:MAG: sodium/solute symporter [Pirellulales bacterium]|nr:sodium/solute symporter [Pirellulales bacterium]